MHVRSGLVALACWAGAGLVPAPAQAQPCTTTVSNNSTAGPSITTAGTVLCITANSYSRDITIDAANCTVNFNGSAYSGNLTVTTNGSNCVINNNSGSTISGSQNNISAATTINNLSGASWSGNFYSGSNRITAPLVVNNAGTWGSGTQLEFLSNFTLTNTGTWDTVLYGNTGAVSKTIGLTNSVGGIWTGSAQIILTGTTTITNAGTWNNNQFAVTGSTVINNSGLWNNAQVNYTGSLTINHSKLTTNSWLAIPNSLVSSPIVNSLIVNNSGTWDGVSLDFPAGPNQFNTLAGGTTTAPSGKNLSFTGNTAITNRGTLTISSLYSVLPAGSSLTNYAGTLTLSASAAYTGLTNNGLIDNRATLNVGELMNGTAGTITNTGTLTSTTRIQNSGTLTNSYKVVATDFTNTSTGTVSGPAAPLRGSVTVSGTSSNAGIFGGGSTNRLDICDSSTNPTSKGGFDTQSGTVGTDVTICAARPLPVELARFGAASGANGRVELSWTTASEKNNSYFAIERSPDGRSFARIGTAQGQGSSATATSYHATDEKPLAGLSYYRLQQVDFDGTATFSPVASVEMLVNSIALTLAPNPATDQVLVDLLAWPAQPGTVEVLSLSGQLMLARPLVGGSAYSLDVQSLSAGVYLLRVRTAGQQTGRRLVKL